MYTKIFEKRLLSDESASLLSPVVDDSNAFWDSFADAVWFDVDSALDDVDSAFDDVDSALDDADSDIFAFDDTDSGPDFCDHLLFCSMLRTIGRRKRGVP